MSAIRLPENPDEIRMSFGDHLEELRRCLIRALIGFGVATVLCFHYVEEINLFLTAPYYAAMKKQGFEPQMVQLDPIESFMQVFTIALQFGLVFSAPWVLYQIWRFVAVGLYPTERKLIQYIAPASMILFTIGATFMVTIVLFGLLKFLIGVSTMFPLPSPDGNVLSRWLVGGDRVVTTSPSAEPLRVPVLNDDPAAPRQGDVWVRRWDNSLNVYVDGERYVTSLKPASKAQFVQPFFSIKEYVGFVTGMALAFGVGFQVPLVVIFLITAGLVSTQQFRQARRFIILSFAAAAAFITPSPDISSMLLLLVPMVVLFESGLIIGRLLERRKAVAANLPDAR